MGIIRYLLLFFLFAGYAQQGEQDEDQIIWDPDRRLTWADFRAEPPGRSDVAALTASGISYSFSSMQRGNEMVINYEVTANFYPSRSWYQPDLASPTILAHEQLHFDITELFARKFRKRLESTRFTENIKAEVRDIFQQINRELKQYQDRYDLETNSSRLMDRQWEWQYNIDLKMAATRE